MCIDMRVSPVTSKSLNKTSFKSCVRQYPTYGYSGIRVGQVLTSTSLFRDDLDWEFLTNYICNNFKNKEKVNAYSLASSDGSEAYSYVIGVMDKISEKEYDKYFPIFASDTDFVVVNAAKTGRINLTINDLYRMEKNTKGTEEYFVDGKEPIIIKNNKIPVGYFYESYKPIEKVKNSVIFEQANLLDKLKTIKDHGNSVVMVRNVALYLKNDYVEDIAKTAEKVLKKGSLFVTGEYDLKMSNLVEELLKHGFEEIKPLIYRRK